MVIDQLIKLFKNEFSAKMGFALFIFTYRDCGQQTYKKHTPTTLYDNIIMFFKYFFLNQLLYCVLPHGGAFVSNVLLGSHKSVDETQLQKLCFRLECYMYIRYVYVFESTTVMLNLKSTGPYTHPRTVVYSLKTPILWLGQVICDSL